VQQHQQNAEFACGLSGPQWNKDYRYHYDWCVQGRNSESAAGWNQWRDAQIAQCRTAKAKPPTAPAGKPSKWDQTVLARVPDFVRYLDQKTGMHANNIARAQTQWAQQRADAVRKTTALRTGPTDAENVKRIDEAAAEFKRRPGTVAPQIPQSALQPRPPQITTFVVEPIKDLVEPKSAILIGGLNFRNQPGRNQPGKVHLRYSDLPPEISYQFKTYDVELQPLKKTWQDSWTDSLIFVRVPDTLPGERFDANRPGKLVISFADGVSIARDVTVSAGNPIITSVTTSSGEVELCCATGLREEWRVSGTHNYILEPIPESLTTPPSAPTRRQLVQPGDTITIIGRFLGNTPGKARLDWFKPIGGRYGMQLTTVRPDDWSDTRITLRAGDFPFPHYVDQQQASLIVETASGREVIDTLAFGPDMRVKRVSGFQLLEGSEETKKQYATPMPNGAAMLVTHTPDCGFWKDSGEKGWDKFRFPNVASRHPEEAYEAITHGVVSQDLSRVKVIQVNFKQIDPENLYSDLDFFVDMAGDLVGELLKYGPAGLITYGFEKVIMAIFSGGGGYHAYVCSGPSDEGATACWETSCENADGKPVIYAISFMVIGPKEVLDKL